MLHVFGLVLAFDTDIYMKWNEKITCSTLFPGSLDEDLSDCGIWFSTPPRGVVSRATWRWSPLVESTPNGGREFVLSGLTTPAAMTEQNYMECLHCCMQWRIMTSYTERNLVSQRIDCHANGSSEFYFKIQSATTTAGMSLVVDTMLYSSQLLIRCDNEST